jgi:hypothetical protein
LAAFKTEPIAMKLLGYTFLFALCLNMQSCGHSHEQTDNGNTAHQGEVPLGMALNEDGTLRPKSSAELTPEELSTLQQQRIDRAKQNYTRGTISGQPFNADNYSNALRMGKMLALEGSTKDEVAVRVQLIDCHQVGTYELGAATGSNAELVVAGKVYHLVKTNPPAKFEVTQIEPSFIKGVLNAQVSDGEVVRDLENIEFSIFY